MKKFGCIAAAAVLAAVCCDRDLSTIQKADPQPVRELTALEKRVSEASNAFGFDLFGEVCREEGVKNVFVSPFSVSMALGMTLNGAAGGTETDMRSVLGFEGMIQDEINASYRGLLDLLRAADDETVMEIANSIWYRLGYPVQPAFIDVNRRYFDAAVREMDFSDPAAPDVINGWISDNTHGRIDRMIEEIDPMTVMFLINAVYFKGTWGYAFDPKTTRDDFFVPDGGSAVPCRMMSQKAEIGYFRTSDFRAVELPYGNGRFAMALFLPDAASSTDAFISGWTDSAWRDWKTRFVEREMDLYLPKFKVEYKITLSDALKALGMAVAFGGRADFSRITGSPGPYISDVYHKSFVEVDEKGTEAAAVTVVEIRETSIGPDEGTIRFDRPFAFAIYEKTSGAMLFMGRIETVGP
ncbi:serpin family protein [bacterium]|nr:serpin family protein [bacterium]